MAAKLLPSLLAALAGTTLLLAPVGTETAVANGDTRTIHLHHAHTHESIDATFMVDGHYDPVVLEKLNWFLRDWRRDEPTHMDPKLFDTIWEVYRESGSHQPIDVMSAYRSPETNSMLRRASRTVAEHSQHILGKAMDQHYVDVPVSKIREIAMRLQRGGVGFYPTAGTPFVHMDVGGVRHWPRMSYDQLAHLFPDGKTVHIPSNGQPLAGYEQARAELEARGDSFDYPTAGEVKSKGFFAWLFGGNDDDGDGEAARESGGSRPAPSRAAPTPQVAAVDAAPVGAISNDAVVNNGKDAGMHLFSFFDAKPADPAPVAPPPATGRRDGATASRVASLPPAQPVDPVAQQRLAQEMRRQEQGAADAQGRTAAEVQARPEAAFRSDLPARPERQLAAPQPLAPTRSVAPVAVASGKVEAPVPPHRPVETATTGPLGPGRTAEVSKASDAGRNDHAPSPSAARTASLASGRTSLPAVITQGNTRPVPVPRVLAFASPNGGSPSSAAPSGARSTDKTVPPIPVARPPLVAARLAPSNVRSVTADQTSARRGFTHHATDLSTEHFSGSALSPHDRVSTATLKKPHPAAED